MATFEKKQWQDRISEHPTRRTLTDVDTSNTMVVEVARAEGEVTNAGDAFNASNMNDLEDRIDAVITEMDENFQAGVDAVYNACVAVGIVPASSTPTDIAAAISNMAGADATAAQILAGKKAYSNGALQTGTMPNRGAWVGTGTPTGNNQVSVTIPAGYHSGTGYVICKGQSSYYAGAAAMRTAAANLARSYQNAIYQFTAAIDNRSGAREGNTWRSTDDNYVSDKTGSIDEHMLALVTDIGDLSV